jgi:ribosomal-protein-alanine N-acetyltransferase
MTELTTKRLTLRPPTTDDIPGLHACYADPETMRFWDAPAAATSAETGQRLAWSLTAHSGFHAAWAVIDADARFVGMVNYHRRETNNRKLELGWMIARPFWQRGYATEAVRALIGHCISALEAHRIEAHIEPDNVASVRLAERLGFQREGVMRDRLRVGDGFRSAILYALLASDWRPE